MNRRIGKRLLNLSAGVMLVALLTVGPNTPLAPRAVYASAGIIKVGSTVPTVASGNPSVTPAWASDMPRTAGDLLIAYVSSDGNAGTIAQPTGWLRASDEGDQAEILYRVATGSDAAPTFTVGGTGSKDIAASLEEFTGNAASPLVTAAKVNGHSASSTTLTLTEASNVKLAGSLSVFAYTNDTTSATDSRTDSSGWTHSGFGRASTVFFGGGSYHVNPPTGSADSDTATFADSGSNNYGTMDLFVPATPGGSSYVIAHRGSAPLTESCSNCTSIQTQYATGMEKPGDIEIVRVGAYSSVSTATVTINTPSSGRGGWTLISSQSGTPAFKLALFYRIDPNTQYSGDAAPTVSISVSSGTPSMDATVDEFTPGILQTSSEGSGSTTGTSLTITAGADPSSTGGVTVSALEYYQNSNTITATETPGTGFTQSYFAPTPANYTGGEDYHLNPSTSSLDSEALSFSTTATTKAAEGVSAFFAPKVISVDGTSTGSTGSSTAETLNVPISGGSVGDAIVGYVVIRDSGAGTSDNISVTGAEMYDSGNNDLGSMESSTRVIVGFTELDTIYTNSALTTAVDHIVISTSCIGANCGSNGNTCGANPAAPTNCAVIVAEIVSVTGLLPHDDECGNAHGSNSTAPDTGLGAGGVTDEFAPAAIGWNGTQTISGITSSYETIGTTTGTGTIGGASNRVNIDMGYEVLTSDGFPEYSGTLSGASSWDAIYYTFT